MKYEELPIGTVRDAFMGFAEKLKTKKDRELRKIGKDMGNLKHLPYGPIRVDDFMINAKPDVIGELEFVGARGYFCFPDDPNAVAIEFELYFSYGVHGFNCIEIDVDGIKRHWHFS